jgi:ADP-ribose diphosphatase
VDRYELGCPKGRIEEGEDTLDAANRELMEETGYGARRLEHLKTFTIAPGLTGHLTEVVLARDLYPQKQDGDEPEEIEVVPWPLVDIDRLLEQADCTEARSVAALYMVKEKLKPTG